MQPEEWESQCAPTWSVRDNKRLASVFYSFKKRFNRNFTCKYTIYTQKVFNPMLNNKEITASQSQNMDLQCGGREVVGADESPIHNTDNDMQS